MTNCSPKHAVTKFSEKAFEKQRREVGGLATSNPRSATEQHVLRLLAGFEIAAQQAKHERDGRAQRRAADSGSLSQRSGQRIFTSCVRLQTRSHSPGASE